MIKEMVLSAIVLGALHFVLILFIQSAPDPKALYLISLGVLSIFLGVGALAFAGIAIATFFDNRY